jgi:hypothetical protein
MVPVLSLWLPILLSAAAVFVISSLIHMVLGYHSNDYRAVPDEDALMAALRPLDIPPGDYFYPRPRDLKAMNSPEFRERRIRGPAGIITVLPNGWPGMTRELVQWFIYSVVVMIFAAYIAGRALGPGAHYLEVFRFAGATTFVGFGLALWQHTIWYKRSWLTTLKSNIDALIYALVTGGMFGWLWP